uniref:Tumor necrosis factor receptor superfamily, member a n=1 Tax=Periophthalmus magnuspinnatus TaxID=409849 RepID=A0A3B4AUC4_9GOBI
MNVENLSSFMQVLVALLFGGYAAEMAPVAQWSSEDITNLTLKRHRTCVENEQYLHLGLCCLNCHAGTFVQKACEREQEQGTCLPCEHGQTYTEHSNGMNRCLPCTHCRLDEIETASCTTTTDTRCQCRPGTFCVPDQACEVCKRCCAENGTHFPLQNPLIPIFIILVIIVIAIIGVALWWFLIKQQSCEKPCSGSTCESSEIVKIPIDESGDTAEERQNNQNAGLEGEEPRPESRPLLQETQSGLSKASPPLEDEDRGLGDSLPNTTSSSQTSLPGLPTGASSGSSPHQSPSPPRLTPADNPLGQRLVPLQGSEKSLKKSFDLFDEYLDVRIHNKFFRLIGVSDNHIRIAENGPPGDKVYELLKNWMQRQGLKADINDLLDALLSMDQRRSAENIASAALRRGYYKHVDTP